jgi:hypothetical protein
MLDLTKPIQTRDGHPARVLVSDIKGADDRVVALIDMGPEEILAVRTKDGVLNADKTESDGDLVNADVAFVNVYTNPEDSWLSSPYSTKEEALAGAWNDEPHFTIKITRIDGEVTAVGLA